MQRKIDLVGQKIHTWIVKEYYDKDKKSNSRWKCECELCGDIKLVWGKCFINKKVAPCSCIKLKEMIGKKIGKLTIINFSHTSKRCQSYWLCKCECGKEKTIRESHLSDNTTISCGCERIKNTQNRYRHKLIGKKFGYWTVIDYGFSHKKTRIHWLCRCECGTEKTVCGTELKKGTSLSCGCKQGLSRGEEKIVNWLIQNNIKFNRQQTFKGCKSIKSLRFDFYLLDYNLCIEYQGVQHYKLIQKFGGEEDFKNRQLRDQVKRDFCKNNKIELLEISYVDKKNIEEILKNKLMEIKKDGEFSPSI